MACLVLHLRHQDCLALQRWRARDPVAFRQHADDLRMGVLLDLPNERAAVSVGHLIFRLDLDVGVNARLERLFVGRHFVGVADFRDAGFDHLCVHRKPPVLATRAPERWRSP